MFSAMSGTDVDQNLLQDIRLYENSTERERVDSMSELYAVLNSLECLEKLFTGDYISPEEYTAECTKLLRQYKTALRQAQVANIDEFVAKYQVTCPAALERIREGHPVAVKNKGNTLKLIKDVVETFITFIDQLKLNERAVDALFPSLNDLYISIAAVTSLPDNADSKVKVKKWYDRLNGMNASEEISDEEARQMIFELETAYDSFNRFLEMH